MNRGAIFGSGGLRLGKQSPGKEVGYRRGWSRGGRIAASLFEYPVDECAEFQLLENLAEFFFVRFFADERIHVELNGNICFDGGKEFGEGNHLAVGLHFRFQCAFQLVGMLQQIFDAAEFGNQFLCGFLAHTRTAGDVVGSITHQSQHVDDLLGGLYVELGFYFFGTHHFESAGVLGAVHEDAVRYQLPVVLVGSHHIGGDALSSGFGGKRAYHVVCLITGYLEDGDAVGTDDILYNRNGEADGLGRLLALCLVLFVGLVAEGGARRVEGYSYVCGILFFEHFFQGVYKAQNGRSVESF